MIGRRATTAAAMALVVACTRSHAGPGGADAGIVVSAPAATAPGAPRPGMVWIPAGVLRAGSAVDEAPRVAEAELPGVDVPMAGFYMDVLPWPNEAGAIPTTNVSREEAARLCDEKGKRLCTELEWERACKGPAGTRYEYGAGYDARACGAGAAQEASARRPSGERAACRSGFGARDMHGGALEWTDSRWGRGAPDATSQGVLRGGNDAAGELVTRCAYARPIAAAGRSPWAGFRCCVGPHNDASVELEVKTGPIFEKVERTAAASPALDALGGVACGPPTAPAPCSFAKAWTWRPEPNVVLSVAGGCVGQDPSTRCALAVARAGGATLAQVDAGREIPDVVLVEGAERRIRVRGADAHGRFFRDVVFYYGRVDVR
jgi:formylglycine-generating enzyme required for sulfatase activity